MGTDSTNPSKFKIWWKDLWEFICALWPHTSAKITGGSVAAVIAILLAFGVPIPRWVYWALLSLAFFASAFVAYRRQRQVPVFNKIDFHWPLTFLSFTSSVLLILVFVNYSTPVQRLTRPHFSLDEIKRSVSDSVDNLRNHFVTFDFTIFNDGAPSVVREWNLNINGRDQTPVKVSAIIVEEGEWRTNWPTGGTNYTLFSTKDSFVGKDSDVPIPRGGKRHGFITFLVPDLSRAYLDDPDTKYEIIFWDVSLQEYDYPNMTNTPPSK